MSGAASSFGMASHFIADEDVGGHDTQTLINRLKQTDLISWSWSDQPEADQETASSRSPPGVDG